ncbi:MAG: transaldolase [Bacteroidota bacterium]|nr:transaldolase [Bacteroidota bacterium]|tara:strand:- start:1739 stop:2449 length:711 start_codon:yes stop_codon:yes gene_type:complete
MSDLKVKIYADGADLEAMSRMDSENFVSGFTTNPTLMARNGIKDYLSFAKQVLNEISDKSISFEVFSDDLDDMYRQALILRDLGDNVWVKIPVTNTQSVYTYDLIHKLSNEDVKINATALFTKDHIDNVYNALNKDVESIISIFAGRIANAGIDPEITMKYASDLTNDHSKVETLWASAREVFNIMQAERCNTDIITLPFKLIDAYKKEVGKNLDEFSLETVKMFYDDAKASGYSL